MNKNKLYKIVLSFILGVLASGSSYQFSSFFLNTYEHNKQDVINVLLLFADFSKYDYLSKENIYIYFPTLIYFMCALMYVGIVQYRSISGTQVFVCSRVKNCKELKKFYTRDSGLYIVGYNISFWLCTFFISGRNCVSGILFLCMLERLFVMFFLNEFLYFMFRKYKMVFAILYCMLMGMGLLMIDVAFNSLSIFSIPSNVVGGIFSVVTDFLVLLVMNKLANNTIGKNEIIQ